MPFTRPTNKQRHDYKSFVQKNCASHWQPTHLLCQINSSTPTAGHRTGIQRCIEGHHISFQKWQGSAPRGRGHQAVEAHSATTNKVMMHLMSQVEGLNVWQSLPQIDDGIIQFYFFHPVATKTTWQHVTWSRTRYRLPAAGTSHTDGSAVRKHICQHLCFPQTFQHLQRPMPASGLGLKGADGAVDAHLGHLGGLNKQIRLCFKMSIWANMTTGQVMYHLESQH